MRSIYVFGSNLAGRHGKGTALTALKKHGAVYGVGEGLQGESYGIPTKDCNIKSRPLDQIAVAVQTFIEFASQHPEMSFKIMPIGCGLAGYKPSQIAPMFRGVPGNCLLPDSFIQVLLHV